MSKRKNDRPDRNASAAERSKVNSKDEPSSSAGPLSVLRRNLWMAAIVAFLCLGALGGTLKYLGSAPAAAAVTASAPSSLRPHPPSLPTSPPQLSKEYIHAGSRLLTIEDANATAAPPADLAVWRPSTGVWHVLGQSGWVQQTWGQQDDDPVEGDYDGDGKTDFSIFRPTSNQWYLIHSSTGNPVTLAFGEAADLPAQADYDGDGKTDRAVFRPANGRFYVHGSTAGFYYTDPVGQQGDMPASADYDGDGRADVGFLRGSTFYWIDSSGGPGAPVRNFPMGATGAPVSGDYDGDGRADHAVFNAGTWHIRHSSTGQVTTLTGWGQAGDEVVHNDYDADGKTDRAVWRPSNATWYILNSADNSQRIQQWGATGDVPVPALYRR